jgi:signal transduction histidine kinase
VSAVGSAESVPGPGGTTTGRPIMLAGLVAYAGARMDPIARWLRACPPGLADVLLAAVITTIAIAGTAAPRPPHGYRAPDAVALVVTSIAGVSLTARRRWPIAVFATTLLASVIYAARGYPAGPALLTVLVSIYTAASRDRRVRSLALGLAATAGIGTARLLFTHQTPGEVAGKALGWIGASLFLGWAVANRRAFVAEIRDRAERAERTRDTEARRRVDAERLRIARELHDVVAHGISTINVQAGVAAHLIDRRPEQAGEALEAIKRLSKEALGELREILEVLRAVDTDDPRQPVAGLAQLDALIARSRAAGIGVTLDVAGVQRTLPVAVDLAAYRIIQEALTNVVRHAGQATARVQLAYSDRELLVEVNDDGTGPPTVDSPASAGYGLIGMRERAESLGGTFRSDGQPGDGFRVQAKLPAGDGGS